MNPGLSEFGARILILASNTTVKSIQTAAQFAVKAEIITAISQTCNLHSSSWFQETLFFVSALVSALLGGNWDWETKNAVANEQLWKVKRLLNYVLHCVRQGERADQNKCGSLPKICNSYLCWSKGPFSQCSCFMSYHHSALYLVTIVVTRDFFGPSLLFEVRLNCSGLSLL